MRRQPAPPAITSLGLSWLGYLRADVMLGIVVASIIAWSGLRILRDSIPILVDARAVDEERLFAIVDGSTSVA